jgi:hypothetical protein
MRFNCLSLVISFRGQEASHLLDGRETNCSDRWNNVGYLTGHSSSSEGSTHSNEIEKLIMVIYLCMWALLLEWIHFIYNMLIKVVSL